MEWTEWSRYRMEWTHDGEIHDGVDIRWRNTRWSRQTMERKYDGVDMMEWTRWSRYMMAMEWTHGGVDICTMERYTME